MIKHLQDRIYFVKAIKEVIYNESYDGLSYDVVEEICRQFISLYITPSVSKFIGLREPKITFSYSPPKPREIEGQEAYYLPKNNSIVMAIRSVHKKTSTFTGRTAGSYFNTFFLFRAIESISHEYQHFIQHMLVKMVAAGQPIPEEFKKWFVVETPSVVCDFKKENKEENVEFEELKNLTETYPEMKEFVESVDGKTFVDKLFFVIDAKYYCRADEVDARFVAIKLLQMLEESVIQTLGDEDPLSLYIMEYKTRALSKENFKLSRHEPVARKYNEIMQKIKNAGILGE